MPGEIISEHRARSNRNGGRHHRGFAGDFPLNPQPGPKARGHRCAAPQSAGRKACLAGKAGKHYCRSRRITPSVEKWRREHPHDTPPYPFMPSPTSANSSPYALVIAVLGVGLGLMIMGFVWWYVIAG